MQRCMMQQYRKQTSKYMAQGVGIAAVGMQPWSNLDLADLAHNRAGCARLPVLSNVFMRGSEIHGAPCILVSESKPVRQLGADAAVIRSVRKITRSASRVLTQSSGQRGNRRMQ